MGTSCLAQDFFLTIISTLAIYKTMAFFIHFGISTAVSMRLHWCKHDCHLFVKSEIGAFYSRLIKCVGKTSGKDGLRKLHLILKQWQATKNSLTTWHLTRA